MSKNNLWILTEERPKESVIKSILEILENDFNLTSKRKKIMICPIIQKSIFQFTYIIKGIKSKSFKNVYLKIVSGNSSFIDYLVCLQEKEPIDGDCSNILMAVEETKTGDDDSRNTGVYQRCSKFIYSKIYLPNTKLYMLYNEELKVRNEKEPSQTNIFGTNMLLTMGVSIIGKENLSWFKPFTSIDELIEFKAKMKKPPASNEPINITKFENSITISGRLDKPQSIGKISHDPNIGALSIIAYTLRLLGWTKKIEIVNHHILQQSIKNNKNKFLMLCKNIDISMQNLQISFAENYNEKYWHYEYSSEKVASILLHLMCTNVGVRYIYENHAGCERGYFKTADNRLITLPKKDRNGENLLIPDLVLADMKDKNIYLIEGKKLSTLSNGIQEIEDYDSIEEEYIKLEYPCFNYLRYLSIFGGTKEELPDRKIMLYLNQTGLVIMNKDLPKSILKKFKKIKKK